MDVIQLVGDLLADDSALGVLFIPSVLITSTSTTNGEWANRESGEVCCRGVACRIT